MRYAVLTSAFVFFSAAAAIAGLDGPQANVAAHVLDVRGQWNLEGTTYPIKAGQGMVTGARITAKSNQPGDFITVLRDEDMSRNRVVCDDSSANPCLKPIVVENAFNNAPSSTNQLKTLALSAFSILLGASPATASHFATTLSRGMDTVQESEAVVALDPVQGVVLPPAPADLPAGRYTFSIARIGEKSAAAVQENVLTSRGTWKPLALPGVGLYEISIANEDLEQEAEMMVMVVSPLEYETKLQEFEMIRSRTATWKGPGAQADGHRFLRAYMLSSDRP